MFLWAKHIQKFPCLLYLIQIFGMKLEEISLENAVGTFCIRNAPSEMKKKLKLVCILNAVFFSSVDLKC